MKKSQSTEVRPVMSIKQASDYLGINSDTLYKYANSGFVPGFRMGNLWRFSKVHLDAWMDKQVEANKKP